MTKTKLINYVSAFLLLILVVMQFLPFWTYPGKMEVINAETGKKEKVEAELDTSIQNYIWFPEDNKDCTTYLQKATADKEFACGDIILFPVLALILTAVCIACVIINPEFKFIFLFPLVVGVIGVISLIGQVPFALGNGTNFTVQMALAAPLAILGISSLFSTINDAMEKKA